MITKDEYLKDYIFNFKHWGVREKSAAIILAIHGYNDHSGSFKIPANFFQKFNIYTTAFDLRGFGRNEDLGEWYPLSYHINDIKEKVLNLKKENPSKDIFLADIEKKNLFIFKNDSGLIGCVALSYDKDIEYNDIKWLTKDDENLYVHRLAVEPKFQKQGIGRLLMDFAEDYARDKKLKSVRLDTFSKNERNNRFYKSRKYTQLDDVYFPDQSEFPFHCYEKILD
mgnify:CR=1 FL=1